jgi:hypothetical protein
MKGKRSRRAELYVHVAAWVSAFVIVLVAWVAVQ